MRHTCSSAHPQAPDLKPNLSLEPLFAQLLPIVLAHGLPRQPPQHVAVNADGRCVGRAGDLEGGPRHAVCLTQPS